jgi:hypothetical protein
MAALKPPTQQVSFADIAKNNPRGPFPGDRLDAQIQNLIEAIRSTQQALKDIRADDGKLKAHSVGQGQLATDLKHTRAEIDSVEARITHTAELAQQAASRIVTTVREASGFARDAESAAVSAAQFLTAVNAAQDVISRRADIAINATATVDAQTSDAENWANYSQAHAEVSETNQEQAAAWAEYLAGPVVNPNDAPAYTQTTPWGHGLYYQPVEGGLAGLWSAKWWALYAQQLVGHWNFYYLGAWPTPPMPGEANPGTGLVTPDPLAPGSFYYNTETGALYVWDGTQWVTPIKATPAYQANYVYVATAGQKIFTGPDVNSNIPLVTKNDSDVHLNGIRLVGGMDYTVDKPTSTLTLAVGATVNSIIQWDILVEASQLAPGAISVFKLILSPAPDGTNKIFDMKYNNPTMGHLPIAASQVAEVAISIDGIVQEPAVDFTATGAVLTMSSAPQLGCRMWGTWHASDLILP